MHCSCHVHWTQELQVSYHKRLRNMSTFGSDAIHGIDQELKQELQRKSMNASKKQTHVKVASTQTNQNPTRSHRQSQVQWSKPSVWMQLKAQS